MSDTIVWSADTGSAMPVRHQGRDIAISSILKELESRQQHASQEVLDEQQKSRLSWADLDSDRE